MWLFLIFLYNDNWVKNQAFDFQILWTSLYPDQKVKLSSKSVHFFSRLSSFIAFSRPKDQAFLTFFLWLFRIFLFHDNWVQNQAFDFLSCYKVVFSSPYQSSPCKFLILAKKEEENLYHMDFVFEGLLRRTFSVASLTPSFLSRAASHLNLSTSPWLDLSSFYFIRGLPLI